MKRQISISIFLALLVIFLTLLYIKVVNESKSEYSTEENKQLVQQKNTDSAISISQEYVTYLYYVKDEDGWLVAFHCKTGERYMDTGIATETLSEEMQAKAESGFFFKTEAELYNFLESYSS